MIDGNFDLKQTDFNKLKNYSPKKKGLNMSWLEWLRGKKTYVIVILGFIFNLGVIAGWWPVDSELWSAVNTILGFLGLGTLRAGVSKGTV